MRWSGSSPSEFRYGSVTWFSGMASAQQGLNKGLRKDRAVSTKPSACGNLDGRTTAQI